MVGGGALVKSGSGRPLIILGSDGMDPRLVEEWMKAGLLPNLAAIAAQGGYGPLATTNPAESPVAWSTAITGLNPGKHGVYGFLHRDPVTYFPRVGMVTITEDMVVGHRGGRPFWNIAGEQGIRAAIARVPATYPPEELNGVLVCGLGVPDLLRSWGTSSLYTSEPTTGRRYQIPISRGAAIELTSVNGPDGSEIPMRLEREPGDTSVGIEVGGIRCSIGVREWSPWIPLVFSSRARDLHGMCRFFLLSLSPEVRLYRSPIHQHPSRPMYPFTYPEGLAQELVDGMGLFPTLGWPEDATGLGSGHLDGDAFLEQTYYMLAEQERLTLWMLGREEPDLLVAVTEATDRVAHAYLGAEESMVVRDCYQRFDAFVGRVLRAVSPDATVLVISDHGCVPVRRVVHLNSWLRDSGYLVVEQETHPQQRRAPFWHGVDWTRTRAYALGLSHVYLNVRDRERLGCVESGDEYARLCREISAGLLRLRDPDTGNRVMKGVFHKADLYSGARVEDAGDLVVAFKPGYRTSEETTIGGIPKKIFEDNRRRWWSADHCSLDPATVPGILVSNRCLDFGRARLLDIAPTALELLGVPIPGEMDGRSLVS